MLTGRANIIMDNLIARKKAVPMIVVMPLGYGTMEVVTGGWGGLGRRDLWKTNVEKFKVPALFQCSTFTPVLPNAGAAE